MKRIKQITTHSPEETYQFGKTFGQQLQAGDMVTFIGDLGAGKTTCIRGICDGLDISQTVTSPTFTLVNEYNGRLPIYHFDFYRIGSEYELVDLGLEEYFNGDGVCLLEWPQVAENYLPSQRYEMRLYWNFEAGIDQIREIHIYKGE